jgi:hypothetical protein
MTDIIYNTIDDLDITKKYMIVGVRKSGTQSLKKYLIDKGFNIECFEGRFSLPEYYNTHDYSRIPIVILRDPVERAWSDYEYFKEYNPPMNPNGLSDSIEVSKYDKYLKHWDCIIFSLEDLMKLDDFPKININEKKIPISINIKKEIEILL